MMSTVPAIWFPAIRSGSGADVFTERLVSGLRARGIRAEITWLPLRAEYAPWSVFVPEPPTWANIVHVNSWLHPRFLPRGLPVISTLHSCVHDPMLSPYKRPLQRLYHQRWIRRMEVANLRQADRIVAVSRYTAKVAAISFGLTGIDVIHNGVDTNWFHPVKRTEPNHPFRLLYVGNWSARKGVDLLAPILTALGDGFELAYTEDRNGAHEPFDLPSNCRNLGRLNEESLVEAYQQADALLFPSRLEGLPLSVLEAMACGLPVIAADGSSLPEMVENGDSGLLFPQDDSAGACAAARQLAANRQSWLEMKRATRKHIEAYFSLDAMIDRYLPVYCAALTDR